MSSALDVVKRDVAQGASHQ